MTKEHNPNKPLLYGSVIYSIIHIIWVASAYFSSGFNLFSTIGLMLFALPFIGFISLFLYQTSSPSNKCSWIPNVIAILLIITWFVVDAYILAQASAAV